MTTTKEPYEPTPQSGEDAYAKGYHARQNPFDAKRQPEAFECWRADWLFAFNRASSIPFFVKTGDPALYMWLFTRMGEEKDGRKP